MSKPVFWTGCPRKSRLQRVHTDSTSTERVKSNLAIRNRTRRHGLFEYFPHNEGRLLNPNLKTVFSVHVWQIGNASHKNPGAIFKATHWPEEEHVWILLNTWSIDAKTVDFFLFHPFSWQFWTPFLFANVLFTVACSWMHANVVMCYSQTHSTSFQLLFRWWDCHRTIFFQQVEMEFWNCHSYSVYNFKMISRISQFTLKWWTAQTYPFRGVWVKIYQLTPRSFPRRLLIISSSFCPCLFVRSFFILFNTFIIDYS